MIDYLLSHRMTVFVALLLMFIAGQGAYVSVLGSRLDLAKSQKDLLSTQLSSSRASVQQLELSLEDQNTAIEKIKSAADERVKAHAAEVQKAQQLASTYKARAEELLRKDKPNNKSSCDAVDDLINEELRNAKK